MISPDILLPLATLFLGIALSIGLLALIAYLALAVLEAFGATPEGSTDAVVYHLIEPHGDSREVTP